MSKRFSVGMSPRIAASFVASLFAVHVAAAEHDMVEVVVTGPCHQPVSESALPVGVLSGEELRKQVSNSLGDTLKNQPGVHSASFGPGVGQPVIRGQSGKRVQVLQIACLFPMRLMLARIIPTESSLC